MIRNESGMDRMSVVNRMLAYQQANGESIGPALQKTRANLPAQYQNSIDAVEKMLAGDEGLMFIGYGSGPHKLIGKLAEIIRQEDGDVNQLFIATRDCVQDAMVQARDYWSGFNSLIVYLVVVFVLAMSVIALFTRKVLPGFAEVFSSFGEELPALTHFFLQNDVVFMLITGGLGLALLLCVASAYHIRKQVAQLEPLDKFYRWMPGIRSLDAVYSYFLFVRLSNALTIAGVKDDASLNHAKQLANLTKEKAEKFPASWQAVISAQQLGVMTQEIDYQVSQINALFDQQIIRLREALGLVTQLALGSLIGLLLIAMYLPIFMMGSAI